MSRIIEPRGTRYGRWTVLGPDSKSASGRTMWLVRCDCGTERAVSGKDLRNGRSTGCRRCATLKHGHGCRDGRTRTYDTWLNMRQRCTNPLTPNYADYGGRGIRVCERWQTFENFLADVGERPVGLSLDRYPDTNGNYEPGNVRWATRKEQMRNTRSNVVLEFQGVHRCVAEWAENIGISRESMLKRISKGWPVDRLFAPPDGRRHSRKP